MVTRPSHAPNFLVWLGLNLVAFGLVGVGCRTTGVDPAVDPDLIAQAVGELGRPPAGNIAALYELTVPSSGGLRLSLLEAGNGGRMTVSEPFGAAVSMVDWGRSGRPTLVDFREGCSLEGADMLEVLGVNALPLRNAARLLGGRLPVVDGDRVAVTSDGRIDIEGKGWAAVVTVEAEPWRVTRVEEVSRTGPSGWKIRLKKHTGSVPGWIRVDGGGREWVELELIRLQWDTATELPPVPSVPSCTVSTGGG